MSDFLTAIRTISLNDKPQIEAVASTPSSSQQSPARKQQFDLSTADDVLLALRSQPDHESLRQILRALQAPTNNDRTPLIDLRKPSPLAAKITNELVSTTIPDYWSSVTDDSNSNAHRSSLRALLLDSLRNIPGIGAVTAKLRLIASKNAPDSATTEAGLASGSLSDLVTVLEALLQGDGVVTSTWSQVNLVEDNVNKSRLLWKEFTSLMCSGKVISAVAQAQTHASNTSNSGTLSWLAEGPRYAAWLGRNVAQFCQMLEVSANESAWIAGASLCGRSFSLGYTGEVVSAIIVHLLLTAKTNGAKIQKLLSCMQSHEQTRFLHQALKFLTQYYDLTSQYEESVVKEKVGIASAMIASLVGENKSLREKLVEYLSDPATACTEPLKCRRAVTTVITSDEEHIQNVMEANMKLFGESLFIRHAPIIQQETCAEDLLLSAGYVHRSQPMFLFALARSSTHMSGVSNRLNSTSTRARVLGMCVGMAISDLIDKPAQKMDFGVEDVKTLEAKALMALTQVNDTVGKLEDAVTYSRALEKQSSKLTTIPSAKLSKQSVNKKTQNNITSIPKSPAPTNGPRVIEVLSDSEDDLVPYAKPDSDPSDSDDDPTLVNRSKSRAPVYIRDLIAGLQDSENHDRHVLALLSAASLIRRKAHHGKEVSDHAFELGTILASLHDNFDTKNFASLRLQALIALIISDPKKQAPWFARQVFQGDYSLSQRATLLSALGLSARDLAGYKDDDVALNPSDASASSFLSKRLPERYHALYSSPAPSSSFSTSSQPQSLPSSTMGVQNVATTLQNALIAPLAASALDASTGPSILKTRTFSSTRTPGQQPRTKKINNSLAAILAESYFYPLTGHWWTHANAYGRGSGGGRGAGNIHFQPLLLNTFVKTLALLLHASGPGTVQLPQLTGEFWDLLLGLRSVAVEEVVVMEAVLFGLMVVLEVNEDSRRLAETRGREVVETREWVGGIFERLPSGGDKETERIRVLAASVLVRTGEVVEKFQRLMVGDLMDF